MKIEIYTLTDCATEAPFYVGSSKITISERVKTHNRLAKNGDAKVYRFIRDNNICFKIEVIDIVEITKRGERFYWENYWAETLHSWGFTLQNNTFHRSILNSPSLKIDAEPTGYCEFCKKFRTDLYRHIIALHKDLIY